MALPRRPGGHRGLQVAPHQGRRRSGSRGLCTQRPGGTSKGNVVEGSPGCREGCRAVPVPALLNSAVLTWRRWSTNNYRERGTVGLGSSCTVPAGRGVSGSQHLSRSGLAWNWVQWGNPRSESELNSLWNCWRRCHSSDAGVGQRLRGASLRSESSFGKITLMVAVRVDTEIRHSGSPSRRVCLAFQGLHQLQRSTSLPVSPFPGTDTSGD